MHKLIVMTLLCLSAFAATEFGQIVKPTPEKEQSRLEAFSARSGAVVERNFIDAGKIRDVKIQIYKVTDLVTKTAFSGLRLSYTVASTYSSDEKIAVLDADEVDGLIRTIGLLRSDVFPSTRDFYTEVEYRSRGGFEAGAYYSDRHWTAFLKLERYDSKSFVSMKPEEFDQFLVLLQQVKDKLK